MSVETPETDTQSEYPDLRLWFGAAAESRNIDWREAAGEDLDGFRFWEAIQYELNDHTYTLICDGNTVVKAYLDGALYSEDEWQDYADYLADDAQWHVLDKDGNVIAGPFDDEDDAMAAFRAIEVVDDAQPVRPEGFITEDHWSELFAAEPYEHGAEGPMMNYWYPLDAHHSFDPVDAAAKIEHYALCVVEVDDEYGLALTGGGMDLSWDIAGAFVALGYWPPAFIDLPRMGDMRRTEENEKIVYAVIQHAQREIDNLQYKIKRHRDLLETLLPVAEA